MKITTKTAAELAAESNRAAGLWPRGTYDFEVQEASDEVSKSGNEMIKLRLKVYDSAGNTQTVWDYLLDAIAVKLAHACEAMKLSEQYESGRLEAADFDGKAGSLVLYVQKGQNGYPDKNAVADYVRPKASAARAAPNPRKPVPAGGGTDLADEIPFGPCWQ